MIQWNSTKMLRKLHLILGDEVFANVVIDNGALNTAIDLKKQAHLEYMLSLQKIKAVHDKRSKN